MVHRAHRDDDVPVTRTGRLRPIRRGILGGILTLIALAIVTGVVLAAVIGTTLESVRHEVREADDLAAEAAQLRSALLDQQTGLRGYQLTGDDAFLQPYRTGSRREQGALDALILQARDDELRTAAVETGRLAEAWRSAWAMPQQDLVASGGFDAVRREVATGDGRLLFDRVRGALGRVDLAVGEVRSEAIAALDETQAVLLRVILLAVLTYGAALAIGAVWVVSRVGRPLDELVHTAEALERGEQVRFVARRPDEIGTLTETIERLHQTVQQRYVAANAMAERSTVLNRLSELVSYAADEEAVIRAGSAALERLVPSRGGELLLVNPSFDQLRVRSTWGDVSSRTDQPLAIDSPQACPGIRRNAVHVTRSALDAFSLNCEIHLMRSGSLLCVPMISHNEVSGVIHVEREQEDGFADDDVATAVRVAEQVALALANLRLMNRMERQAMTDPLTGLSNARSFDPIVERELAMARRDGQPAALLMLDLDHFKVFNDTHGHPAGDEALRSLARTMRGAMRETDVVARYGGEEFAILLRKTDLAGGVAVAQKLRLAVELTPVEIGPNRFARITASIGVAATDRHGTDRLQLMRLADAALYAAKEGRNRVATAPIPDGEVAAAAPDGPQPTPIRRPVDARGKRARADGGL